MFVIDESSIYWTLIYQNINFLIYLLLCHHIVHRYIVISFILKEKVPWMILNSSLSIDIPKGKKSSHRVAYKNIWHFRYLPINEIMLFKQIYIYFSFFHQIEYWSLSVFFNVVICISYINNKFILLLNTLIICWIVIYKFIARQD